MENFNDWHQERVALEYVKLLAESADASHYSIEVNYRTNKKELLDAYAKLVLGYVSASVKRSGYHVKHVYTEKPVRILIASRNWDDGEWIASVTFNPEHGAFILSGGYWNKDRRTVSINNNETKKLDADDAAGISNQVVNYMFSLKNKEPRGKSSGAAPQKRGPKK